MIALGVIDSAVCCAGSAGLARVLSLYRGRLPCVHRAFLAVAAVGLALNAIAALFWVASDGRPTPGYDLPTPGDFLIRLGLVGSALYYLWPRRPAETPCAD